MDGLVSNSICEFDYLLTGYIGSETFLTAILRTLDIVQANNTNVKYICDPVLGDGGKLYVPEKLVSIYIEKILPRAYMITPNQMEVEYLSGLKINTEVDVVRALKKLYCIGPDVIILTSADLVDMPGKLCCYIVHRPSTTTTGTTTTTTASSTATHRSTHVLEISRVIVNKLTDNHYTGTGDVTAALLLGWIHKLSNTTTTSSNNNTIDSVSVYGMALLNSLCTIQCMLARAQSNYKQMKLKYDTPTTTTPTTSTTNTTNTDSIMNKEKDLKRLISKSKYVELPIIPSKRDIENPPTSSYFQINGPNSSIITWTI